MGTKRDSRCLCTVSQSPRRGLLIYSQHPPYKLPQPQSLPWKKDGGNRGRWWKAATSCCSQSFLEALPAFLEEETAELISRGWNGPERILSNPQKTPRQLGKRKAHWGALFMDVGLSDWAGASGDTVEQLRRKERRPFGGGTNMLPKGNLVIGAAPRPHSL